MACKAFVKSVADPFHCLECKGIVEDHPQGGGIKVTTEDPYDWLTVVLDRSGSMIDSKAATIKGFNIYLNDQRKEGKSYFTLVQFDDVYEVVYDGVPIGDVAERTVKNYLPRGGTALLDAMGKAIVTTAEKVAKLPTPPRSVLVSIITDGRENQSREYNRKQVFDLIDQYKKEGWEFFFLGAEPSSIEEARALGIQLNHSSVYHTSAAGTGQAFRGLSHSNTIGRNYGASGMSSGGIKGQSSGGFSDLAPEEKPDADPATDLQDLKQDQTAADKVRANIRKHLVNKK